MKLRTRFSLVLAGFSLILTVMAVLLVRFVLVQTALRADEAVAKNILNRGRAVLSDNTESLANTLVDWASWDDTYAYMASRSQSYIDSNLVKGTLEGLRFTLIAFYDTNRQIMVSQSLDSDEKTRESVLKLLRGPIERPDGLITRADKAQAVVAGFVWEGSNLWLVAAAPILTSVGEGPSRGTLVTGRLIDESETKRLSHLIRPSLSLGSVARGWIPGKTDIQVQSLTLLQARVVVADVFGDDGVLLTILVPRVAWGQIPLGILFLTGWIVVCGGALVLFAFFLLNRWVLCSVTESVMAIRAGIDASDQEAIFSPLKKVRADEIGDLVDAVNTMLAAYDRSLQGIRASEARYRGLVEATPDAIVGFDENGYVLFSNRAFPRSMGVFGANDLVGRHLHDVLPQVEAENALIRFSSLSVGQSVELGPFAIKGLDSVKRWFLTILTRIAATDGQPSYGLLCMRDITARINAEREADLRRAETLQTQKLASLGTLVAGIAHEVNNPNGIIKFNMNVLRRSIGRLFGEWRSQFVPTGAMANNESLARLEVDLNETVQETLDASDRIAGLVSSLKNFARPSLDGVDESVDFQELTRHAAEWLRHELREKQCRVELDIAPDFPKVTGNGQQLQQVVLNLLQNACDAAVRPNTLIRVSGVFDPDTKTVRLAFLDEGRGIPPEYIEHIQDPFFTTRRSMGGMGLGLSISAAIVKAHGGRLDIQSSEETGTVVAVTLPIDKGSAYDG